MFSLTAAYHGSVGSLSYLFLLCLYIQGNVSFFTLKLLGVHGDLTLHPTLSTLSKSPFSKFKDILICRYGSHNANPVESF